MKKKIGPLRFRYGQVSLHNTRRYTYSDMHMRSTNGTQSEAKDGFTDAEASPQEIV
jgi:hypothetical protein